MEAGIPGELTGRILEAGDGSYSLADYLGGHPDTGQTYRASRGARTLIIRIYPTHHSTVTNEKLTSLEESDALWVYTYAGDAKLLPSSNEDPTAELVWATIRRYAQHTLKDVLLDPQRQSTYYIALEVARALHSLHVSGISHGDIRPSNIIVSGNAAIHLADYGVAINGQSNIEEPLFASPEALIRGALNSPASDLYAYGRLIRALYEHSMPRLEREREILWRLTDECLNLEPSRRPDARKVLETLEHHTTTRDYQKFRRRLLSVRLAAYADVISRLGIRITREHSDDIQGTIQRWIEQLAKDVRETKSFRPVSMSGYQLAHLLGSFTLYDSWGSTSPRNWSSDFGILRLVRYEELNPHQESPLPPPTGDGLDPEWAAEIEHDTREDLADRGLEAEEIEARVNHQLSIAAKLTESVLKSDTFIRTEDVATMMSAQCPGITSEEVRVMRDLGYILSFPVGDVDMYPLFQFDTSAGLPRDCIKKVSDLKGYTRSSWSRGLDWMLRSPLLGDLSPAERLRRGGPESTVIDYFYSTIAA
jgi:Protein kinase domain